MLDLNLPKLDGVAVAAELMLPERSVRDLRVLHQLYGGLTNKQMGAALGITARSAAVYVSQVIGELGARTRQEAVAVAIDRGIVHPNEPWARGITCVAGAFHLGPRVTEGGTPNKHCQELGNGRPDGSGYFQQATNGSGIGTVFEEKSLRTKAKSMKIVKYELTKSHSLVPHLRRERDYEYSRLRVWDDEDTQVSQPVTMDELVNGKDTRPKAQKSS